MELHNLAPSPSMVKAALICFNRLWLIQEHGADAF